MLATEVAKRLTGMCTRVDETAGTREIVAAIKSDAGDAEDRGNWEGVQNGAVRMGTWRIVWGREKKHGYLELTTRVREARATEGWTTADSFAKKRRCSG